MKESHPVETAEYSHRTGTSHEPIFNCWVSCVFKNCDQIISLVIKRNPRYLKKTHKFGIEVPTTVAEALEIDKKNGDTHWDDGISSEMNNVRVAFDVLSDGHNAPIGNQFVKCHMIFDMNME